MRKLALLTLMAVTLFFIGCSSQAVDDSTVSAKVKGKLAADSQTSAIKIGVETKEGIVTLTGTVPTDTEKAKAEQLAKNTEGVKLVVNHIEVNPESLGATNVREKAAEAAKGVGEAVTDAAILAKVKGKLLADGISGTNVDVNDGQVVLNGQVDDPQKKAKAEELARRTDGVKNVTNHLTVKRTKAT
jgi:hyperosmotically inducible periplasmic protein